MGYSLDDVAQMIGDDLPPLSPTATKVMTLANDINCSPTEITKTIKLDPVLSAKVLRLVNSAYFSLSSEIVSLERAVIILGLNTIKNLALSAAVLAVMKDGQQKSAMNGDEFWKHCLGVGSAAKIIAKLRGVPGTVIENFFIAGLLHDLGLLIESQFFPEEFATVIEKSQTDGLLPAEEAALGGLDHCRVGGLLAKQWKLSPDLMAVIRGHHNPAGGGDHWELVQTVLVAEAICNNNEIGIVLEAVPMALDPGALKRLKLPASVSAQVLEPLDEEIDRAMEFLSE